MALKNLKFLLVTGVLCAHVPNAALGMEENNEWYIKYKALQAVHESVCALYQKQQQEQLETSFKAMLEEKEKNLQYIKKMNNQSIQREDSFTKQMLDFKEEMDKQKKVEQDIFIKIIKEKQDCINSQQALIDQKQSTIENQKNMLLAVSQVAQNFFNDVDGIGANTLVDDGSKFVSTIEKIDILKQNFNLNPNAM